MAENQLKPQLDEFIAGNTNTETAGENFFKALANGQNALEGLSIKDLESLQSLIGGLSDDNPLKEQISRRIATKMEQLNAQEVNVASDERDEPQTDSQETQPENIEASNNADLENFAFITEPSYSQFRRSEELDEKNLQEMPNKEIQEMVDISRNAIDVISRVNETEITPDSAVFLKDYVEIVRRAEGAEGNTKLENIRAKVDKQLEVFDEENGLDKLKEVSAEELTLREDGWYAIADKITNTGENIDIIKNLAVQELKLTDDLSFYQQAVMDVAQQEGKNPNDLANIYNKVIDGVDLSDEEKSLYSQIKQRKDEIKEGVFEQKFYDLAYQFETTKAIERVKLSADELYPDKEGMSSEELDEQRKKREKYLEEQITREGGLPTKDQWIEENALRALRNKFSDENISDEELINKYGKEFSELKEAYTIAADEVSTAVKTSYAIKIEQLACRSARITGASGINKNTQEFLHDYAEKNKDSFRVGKMAVSIGKSVALTQGIKYAFGFKGMAVYSAYKTKETINKSWNKYKESLQPGEKVSLLGFCSYLKKNPKELTDVVSKVSKTAVMSTLAIAGTAMGIDNIPGASAAIVGAINAATAVTKIHQNKEAIKNLWKNRGQIMSDWKEKHPKLTKFAKKYKWAGAVLGVAAVAGTAYALLKSDDSQDIIDKISPSSGDNDDMTDFDKKLLAESDGQGMTDAEREQLLKNVDDLKNNSSGDITDPLNLKGGENTDTPTVDENNGNTADATPTTEVPALSEDDINLLKTDCKMGPDPIVAKLQQMGVLSDEDKAQLIGSGGRKDGVASRVLASYLGHPYDDTQVPVHANLTPEQQQELNQFLHSEEYQQQCNECNAAANARRIAKLRDKVSRDDLGNGDNGHGFKLERVNGDDANTTPVQTKYSYDVSQRKKAIFNIVNKSLNTENTEVDLSKYYTPEQLAQMRPEDLEKASMQAAAYQYIEDHGVKRAEIVDAQGNTHTYYRQDVHKDGDITTKRVDKMADGQKISTTVTGAKNGATRVDYHGKAEQVTFTDEKGNTLHLGGEGEDKIKKVVVDPTTGKEYTLVKADDGKTYTLEKDMRTGQTNVRDDMSKRQLNKIYKEAKIR